MNMRSSRSIVSFSAPFTLSVCQGELPAGDYEVLVEEEVLQGLTFEVYRRTATYLLVQDKGGHTGRTELRPTTQNELQEALNRDRAATGKCNHSEAALSPQEDLK